MTRMNLFACGIFILGYAFWYLRVLVGTEMKFLAWYVDLLSSLTLLLPVFSFLFFSGFGWGVRGSLDGLEVF